ncbi:MAG: UDP-3-O-(3-hydroxymyristoyl)glucosamine N-acyltransferase [Chromatiales bacterium]|nr:UDP-3-O-(3-hydroxymyristoyl)glucosamine N-acyltransferase [Chromatiales bacterium]
MAWSLGELAERSGAELRGDAAIEIERAADLREAKAGDLSFLTGGKFAEHLPATRASAVILAQEHAAACPCAVLVSKNPYLTYARAAALLYPRPRPPAGIHPSAVVHSKAEVNPSAVIGPNAVLDEGVRIAAGVVVGPGCVIGARSTIGEDSELVANVTLGTDTVVGKRNIFHPGAVIGADGFGMANDQGHWVKIPQIGRVVTGDDVEIGANTTVDRGALQDTVLADGVKIDNLVQVAHNVHIGEHSAIAGCVGIAGSAHIGAYCTLAGGVGVVGHLTIGDHIHVTGMSMVSKSLSEPGVYSAGVPLQSNRDWHRNFVRFKQLDDMAKRLKKLEKTLAEDAQG